MKVFAIFVLSLLTIATAFDDHYAIIEDENGQEFYYVPSHRVRTEVKWGFNNQGLGASHTSSLVNNRNHQLDATGTAFKNYGSHGFKPDQVGGRLDYLHKPTGSNGFVSADRTRNWGTDVAAGVKYNVHQSKNFGVDLSGQYGRHFGGSYGTSKPQMGVMLRGQGRW